MPTGYTYQIQQGISFEQFVLSCAKAFGACITMRDEPMDTPIPEKFEPSDYHVKQIKEISSQIEQIKSYDIAKCEQEAKKEYDDEIKRIQKYIEEKKKIKIQYEDMLKKVEAWQPPTKDHEELKDFMIKQIKQSIDFDCNLEYSEKELKKVKLKTALTWKSDKLIKLNQELVYHNKENKEEIERANGRNLWIKQLRDSLKKE